MTVDDAHRSRRSIWSVSGPAAASYFAIFAAQVLAGLGIAVGWQAGYDHPVARGILSVYQEMGNVVLVAAAMAVIVAETGGQVMVLAKMTREWLERRIEQADERATARGIALGRAEGHAEGHAEGRAEGHAEGRVEGRAEEREYLLGALRQSNPGLEIPELEVLPPASNGDRSTR